MSVHRSGLRSYLAVVVLAVAVPLRSASAQVQQGSAAATSFGSARVVIARALPPGDGDALKHGEALLERAITVAPNDAWLLHYLGYALYREATLRMGRDGEDTRPLMERADSILERSIMIAAIPESHALRSGLLGMMIGTNPLRGMTLGPKSGEQIEKALALGPNNPRVWLLRGIGAIHTPSMFGGGLDRAEEYIKKSIALFESDKPASPAPNWGKSEAHTWL